MLISVLGHDSTLTRALGRSCKLDPNQNGGEFAVQRQTSGSRLSLHDARLTRSVSDIALSPYHPVPSNRTSQEFAPDERDHTLAGTKNRLIEYARDCILDAG
jgi:hypothetical protein